MLEKKLAGPETLLKLFVRFDILVFGTFHSAIPAGFFLILVMEQRQAFYHSPSNL
jgi:hypothetical protein